MNINYQHSNWHNKWWVNILHSFKITQAGNWVLHTIKLCALTNLIRRKFSDLAVILAVTVYERCTQVFSVAKTQGSSTSFSLSYHSAISENLFKGYFFTARVDFGVAFSINLLFSPDISGFRKALEHNAMSSLVSVVRRRKVLNACEI